MPYAKVSKGPAVTTQYEALIIDSKVIKNVVSAPELAQAPERVDATNLSSSRRSYIPGVPDYGEELTWVVNAQINDNPTGNLSRLKALDPEATHQIERRLFGANVRCIFRGYVRWSLGGASVNGIQTITITVTPTTRFSFSTQRKDPDTEEGSTLPGYGCQYYGYCIIGGERVYLQVNGADAGDSGLDTIGYVNFAQRPAFTLSGLASDMRVSSVDPPEGYEFLCWCEDPVGEGPRYLPGEKFGVGCVRTDLWPVLVPVQPQASLASPLLSGGLQGPTPGSEALGLSVVRPYFEDGSDADAGEDPENEAEEAPEDADGEILEDNDAEEGPE